MDAHLIFLALPVFMLIYAGTEALFSVRRRSLPFLGRPSAGVTFNKKQSDAFSRQLGHLGPNQALLRIPRLRARLELLLLRSGFPYGWKIEDLLVYKEIAVLASVILLWQMEVRNPLVWLFTPAAAFLALDFHLRARAEARQGDMQRNLPGLVDLLALALESGMDLMVAMERIFEKMKMNALKEELQTLLQESRLGSSRKELLQRWAHRTGLPDIQSLSSLIIQSEEMGSPLGTVLRNYAEDMRNRRMVRAEEHAGKIPVKILMPMFVFFFPIVFVIILGPVALEFVKGYK